MVDVYMGWNWAAADRSFRRPLDLIPNDEIAHKYYAQLLSNSLCHDEAIAEVEWARTVDSLAPIRNTFAAMMYGCRYGAAFAAVRHAVTLDPDHFQGHVVLGHLHDAPARPDPALESYRTAHRVSGRNPLSLGFQGSVVGRTGRTDDARQVVATLEQIARSHHVPPCAFALVFVGLGDTTPPFTIWIGRTRRGRVSHHAAVRALVGPAPFRRTLPEPAASDRVPRVGTGAR